MTFFHALQINEDQCIGCSHCMKICPTEAIRVYDGKAHISESRCIDCGKCFKTCPTKAVYINQDDFESIFNFPCRVALIPSVFLGQFPNDISVSRIYAILKEIGFTHVFETESTTPIYTDAKNRYHYEHRDIVPLISTYCPAIVRLIQVKFPGLVDNLIPIKAPIDITAMYVRRKFQKEAEYKDNEVGVFYITPCAAKIAAVKSPVGEEKSNVDGVINMDALYNRVWKKIKEQGSNYKEIKLPIAQLSSDSILTSLTNGERRMSNAVHSLAIDEIDNVIEFLEKVENDEIEGVEFLELRACDQSCPGGNLTCNNRFLTCEKMFARARYVAEKERNGERTREYELEKERDYLSKNLLVGEIEPRSMLSLDPDISKALEKMNKIGTLKKLLPQIDCGLCGAPTCDALAEDIVCHKAKITHCVFVQRNLEIKNRMNTKESVNILETIWGNEKVEDFINKITDKNL
ncbi:MAG: 4Fe-4S dicluster domain-containing protein [Lentimicrobiaceae bacterium]|nr:4Fe-4S dicluster domain-containing protein [Lentimicrobiaceae bacterium]